MIGSWLWGRPAGRRRVASAIVSVGAAVSVALASGAGAAPKQEKPNKIGVGSCKNGGWKAQGFANQGRCVSFYATGGQTSTTTSSTTTTTTTLPPTTSTTVQPTTSTTTTTPASVVTPDIFLGYADDLRSTGFEFVPHPWLGDPSVVFLGCSAPSAECGQSYDAGVIRIDNPAGNPSLTLTATSVDIGPCHFQQWDNFVPATAAPGETFVLTQTGVLGPPQAPPCDGRVPVIDRPYLNFDTSEGPFDTTDPPFSNCDPNRVPAPVIHLLFSNGMSLTVTDTAKVLTTGGTDRFACVGQDEATPYTPVAPADIARVG